MTLRRNTKLGIAALAVVIAAAAAYAVWAVWIDDGVRAGPGPFTAELEQCRSLIEQDLQHVPMEYLERTVWHQGDATELHIGGLLRLTSGPRPPTHNYECLARGGRVVRQEVF